MAASYRATPGCLDREAEVAGGSVGELVVAGPGDFALVDLLLRVDAAAG